MESLRALQLIILMYSVQTRGENSLPNQKPQFLNCASYQPKIKEQEPIGTFVIHVAATDTDNPDVGGSVFYSLPAESKFTIDNRTGEIKTNYVFDRDMPSMEKVVKLTVMATDNAIPPLSNLCDFTVTIEDVNDNAPNFTTQDHISVAQDLKKGQEVMSVFAIDNDDGSNSKVVYSLRAKLPGDEDYFVMLDRDSGAIYLNKTIDKDPGYIFKLQANATDQGEVSKTTSIELKITVTDSLEKPPTFVSYPASPIYLPENMRDINYNIATFTANSNTDEESPDFELVHTGNKTKEPFCIIPDEVAPSTGHVRLSGSMWLDYEEEPEYELTIRIKNRYSAAETSIKILLTDMNDQTPKFNMEETKGFVLENEPPGTFVIQVHAVDQDGTEANNQVSYRNVKVITYKLADNTKYFAIDARTGNISTTEEFNKEVKSVYNVKVLASDNAPSAILNNGEPNVGFKQVTIFINDKNDNAPKFEKTSYYAKISERSNKNEFVIEVKANDIDSDSNVRYSIVGGNDYNNFKIIPNTGRITLNNPVDYEFKVNYTLNISASDGVHEDHADVHINIENANDANPEFYPFNSKITIKEQYLEPGCLAELRAYDPDIPDRKAPQHIVYSVIPTDSHNQHFYFTINNNGCLSLLQALDREPPYGHEKWQVIIMANDRDGKPPSQYSTVSVDIQLEDVNDNAPFLDMPGPVIWKENLPPGNITKLVAKDNDGQGNGVPFKFAISSFASPKVQSSFSVLDDMLVANTTFDREEEDSYHVQIVITDSGIPPMTGTSTLLVTIGDENDNPMKPGFSEITVYNYKGQAPNTEIGRVFVEDKDDWDRHDKTFRWANESHPHFRLNNSTGMITMLHNTSQGVYSLKFKVSELTKKTNNHTVDAVVNVTVKFIPEEAVDKSGSMRLFAQRGISLEDFITPKFGKSKKTLLQERLAQVLGTSPGSVDVLTLQHPKPGNPTLLDVRISAHGSPYYAPERVNQAITSNWVQLEEWLGAEILMVNIDECLQENVNCRDSSCSNFLKKSKVPTTVYTNTTSFVGVNVAVVPWCKCNTAVRNICHNGGTPIGSRCTCRPGFEGPHCEDVAIGFRGDGWALYPSFPSCEDSHLSLELQSDKQDGLVFYIGPTNPQVFKRLNVRDFMALELHNGWPILFVDFGTGTVKIEQKQINVSDSEIHRIDIIWNKTSIELQVDNCQLPACRALASPRGPNQFLNVNGPLQLGGTDIKLANIIKSNTLWHFRPRDISFSGCIRNLKFNGKTYNLGSPSVASNTNHTCSEKKAAEELIQNPTTVTASALSLVFCVSICFAVPPICRRRRKRAAEKQDGKDIKKKDKSVQDKQKVEEDCSIDCVDGTDDFTPNKLVPSLEINFLDEAKSYAQEGDGNSVGSLSSLASSDTNDSAIDFDHLTKFESLSQELLEVSGANSSDEGSVN